MSVPVPENPLRTVESPPRARAADVGPPRIPQPVGRTGTVATIPVTFTGEIPATLLDAYRRAGEAVNLAQPGCHLPMELLAAIGKVETNHARGGQVDSDGTTPHPILGPALDGDGFAAIPDTDGGLLDGDTVWDRAVGPMQFLPATWRRWQADGDGDRRADPNNVYDASLAAGRYLCAGNRDLATPQGLDAAILSYNHSASYRNLVLRWLATYTSGTVGVPDDTGGPVPAVLPLPAPPAPPETSTPEPSTPPAPPPPPTSTQPPTSEPPPPSPVPAEDCDEGGLLGGIIGGLLGPLTGDAPCP
jgi:membrane-bound lytic murein transglycosylase B